jgi:phage terminase large subunit-like protein
VRTDAPWRERVPLEKYSQRILALIGEQPDLTLNELVSILRNRRISASRSALSRFFARHGITFKKSLRADERKRGDAGSVSAGLITPASYLSTRRDDFWINMRLNDKQTGSIVAVMQRLHEDDLAGHLIRQGGWDHLDMPAIALENEIIELGHGKSHARRSGDVLHPERESREILEAIKSEVGSLMFSAQYQQRPVPVEGNLIRRSWFPAYDNLPAGPSLSRIVQSWDVAMMTGDQNGYSVCTTWLTHKNDAYLIHVYRGRLEYPKLRRKVISRAAEHRATTILIENAGPGMNLLQDLRADMPQGMTRPIGVKPEGIKVDRMAAQSAKISSCDGCRAIHIVRSPLSRRSSSHEPIWVFPRCT